MIRLKVFVVFYKRTITIALPEDVQPVEQLIPALQKKLHLPYWGDYFLTLDDHSEHISKKKTLRDLGLKNDDVIYFDVVRSKEEDNPLSAGSLQNHLSEEFQKSEWPWWVVALLWVSTAIIFGIIIIVLQVLGVFSLS